MMARHLWIDPLEAISPSPQTAGCVATDFWWLAHDPDGFPLLRRGRAGGAMGVGLAAALLADLVLADRLRLRGPVLVATPASPPFADLAAQTFVALRQSPRPHPLADWLAAFAVSAHSRVAEHLEETGQVVRVEERRWRRTSIRYPPTHYVTAAAPGSRLSLGLARQEPVGERDTLLLLIGVAAGLHPHQLDGGSRETDSFARYLGAGLDGIARDLVLATRTAITRAVLTYRA